MLRSVTSACFSTSPPDISSRSWPFTFSIPAEPPPRRFLSDTSAGSCGAYLGFMKRILVGLDASPRAVGVLDAAIELARRIDARLVLLRAYSIPVGIPIEVYALSPEIMPD